MSDASAPAPRPRRFLRTLVIGVASVAVVLALLVAFGRAAMTADSNLAVGGTAPDFTLPDQTGTAVTLSTVLQSHRGAIVAFYPKDFTPG